MISRIHESSPAHCVGLLLWDGTMGIYLLTIYPLSSIMSAPFLVKRNW